MIRGSLSPKEFRPKITLKLIAGSLFFLIKTCLIPYFSKV